MQKKDRSKRIELTAQQRQAEKKLIEKKEAIKELQKEQKEVEIELATLTDQVRNFEGIVDIKVSDHAVCRYLERFNGVDIEALRFEIASLAVKGRVMQDMTSWKAYKGQHAIVVKDNAVVTIMERK